MLQLSPPFLLFWTGRAPSVLWDRAGGQADDSGCSVRLCLVLHILPLGQPLLGTGECSVPGCCLFTAQLLSPGVFLATSNEASQPNARPLIFATVIHPLAVLSRGCFAGRSLQPLSLQGQAGGGEDACPSLSPSCALCSLCSKCISSWARP